MQRDKGGIFGFGILRTRKQDFTREDCFVFCYGTREEAETAYKAINSAKKPPRPVKLKLTKLATGVPYPYCVYAFFAPADASKIDDWMCGIQIPSSDMYSGVARAEEFHYYDGQGFIEIIEYGELK